MEDMRLDKYISQTGMLSRSEVKKELKKKSITVNDEIVTKPDYKVNPGKDKVCLKGCQVTYEPYVYYMLNKPQGVVSATTDAVHKTVIEVLGECIPIQQKELFPVGRLDIDTEGLLLITNDGELAHQLLSPAKHVEKTYFVRVKGMLTAADTEAFLQGMDIGEKKETKPATLEILSSGEVSEARITITEGKFHQVKRMFWKVEKPVLYLKRISMGPLVLDETLKCGEARKLYAGEVEKLKNR